MVQTTIHNTRIANPLKTVKLKIPKPLSKISRPDTDGSVVGSDHEMYCRNNG